MAYTRFQPVTNAAAERPRVKWEALSEIITPLRELAGAISAFRWVVDVARWLLANVARLLRRPPRPCRRPYDQELEAVELRRNWRR